MVGAENKGPSNRNGRIVVDVVRPACSSSQGVPGRCVNLSECPAVANQPPVALLGDFLCFRLFFIPGVCCPQYDLNEDFSPSSSLFSIKDTTTTASSVSAFSDGERPFPDMFGLANGCGKNLILSMRVVGGDLSQVGQWPWMAAIFVNGRRRREYWCGGTLISHQHILTAAHCMKDARGNKFAPNQLTVKLGTHNLHQINAKSDALDIKITNIKMHENFQANGFYNDIAILKLSAPIKQFTDYIKPICLPTDKMKNENTIGEFATIAGWGSEFYGGAESGVLKQAELPIWDNADCDRVFTQKIENIFVCAGLADGGKDACQGDSGSPLMIQRDNRWIQYGIVSFGEKCAQAGSPGVYTRLTEFLPWITENISNNPSSNQNEYLFLLECGIRPPVRRRRITGGKSARFGDWPWQVSVMQRRFFGFPNMHRCGGALLKASSVVTSAHCVYRLVPALLRVRLGEHDFSGTWEPNAFIERGIRRVIVHPKYDVITLENDVALLEMDAPVTYVGHIAPLCLPPTSTLLIGETGVITGWGRLRENGALPPVLQEVAVRIISNERCEAMFKNAGHSEYIPNTFICTDYISRVPASHCQGDSGGPLQIKGPDGRWFVAGIISWGISCSEPNLPAVYVRISAYKAWLKTLIT
uniref:Peptidase S1 domain-containing protein n=1 Tax=Strigamia maritima TaxID=126957 RepID=T1JFG4_STRMM